MNKFLYNDFSNKSFNIFTVFIPYQLKFNFD